MAKRNTSRRAAILSTVIPVTARTTHTAEQLNLQNNNQKIPSVRTEPIMTGPATPLEYEIVSDQHVRLDMKKAAEYIDLPILPGERAVSTAHVQDLLDKMKRDEFNWTNVIIAKAWLGSTCYKTNGQHTCWAVAYMPEGFAARVREVVYRVQKEEQLRQLYNTYDACKPRTLSQRAKNILIGQPCAEGIAINRLVKLYSAFRLWMYPQEDIRYRLTPEQGTAQVESQYSDLFNAVGRLGQDLSKESRAFDRMPVSAAMFATFAKAPDVVDDFWRPVAEGIGVTDRSDARYQLRKLLERTFNPRNNKSAMLKQSARLMSDEMLFRLCIVAWNRWRRSEPVKILKIPLTRPVLL